MIVAADSYSTLFLLTCPQADGCHGPCRDNNYAIVTDHGGDAWPWYRRDYPSIRDFVELGLDMPWDFEQLTQ